ncbi:MAG: right-handed parallel beta-helix repeat-containing protein [Planctomycetes bacterium]|nr:right-handed parallel beta-helix repeat-containing protein [Planctomycetota bacterium]
MIGRTCGFRQAKPLTIRAAEGQRAVISGMAPLTGWKKQEGNVWSTVVDFKPRRLFVRGRPQRMARRPREGWWKSAAAGQDSSHFLQDSLHLKKVSAEPPLGEVFVWFQKGNIFGTFPIERLDPEAGRLFFRIQSQWQRPTAGDLYWLQNRPEDIDGPGQWAVAADGDRYRVWFWPESERDLKWAEAPRQKRSLLEGRNVAHLRILGLELVGSLRDGIELHGAEDVHINRCIVADNGRAGISLREARGCTVAQNIVRRNQYGVTVSYSRQVTVEENDIGHNDVDGLVVSWKSKEVTIRKNYIHHHLLWGHPDNLQCYRDVSSLLVEDNLLLAAGQSVMLEQARQLTFRGNMIVGCAAYMLIFGHGNAAESVIERNTLAFSGYGCMSLTAHDYSVHENVFMTGHGKPVYGVRGVKGYRADRNVFFNTRRLSHATVMATDAGWHRDFAAAQAATGQDRHSIYADPSFRKAPVLFGVLDHKRLHECTRQRWYLRGGTVGFRVGDTVEVNFDGQARRVVSIDPSDGSIAVAPPLEAKPLKGWLIANWGQATEVRLDLRLRDDSPGAHLASDGGPVGSRVAISAYQSGDFDANGHRDLPLLPDWLGCQ